MGYTSNKTKQQWNDVHYTQVKVSVNPELAAAFKTACASSGISMASAISQYMAEYSKTKNNKKPSQDYSTRQRRRNAVGKMIVILEAIKQSEETYIENIPENLCGSTRYGDAEKSIDALDEAISILSEAY